MVFGGFTGWIVQRLAPAWGWALGLSGLKGSRSSHQPYGKHDDPAQQSEHAVDGNTDKAKRKQNDPDKGIDDQCQQGQRPAEHEQDAPKQKLHHTWQYERRTKQVPERHHSGPRA